MNLATILCNRVLMLGRSVVSNSFLTPWTESCTPLGMGLSRQEYCEWVAMPSSKVSSQPRDRTLVSRIAGGFFTI